MNEDVLADPPVPAGGAPDVLLVTSQGGHLAQLIALEDWWSSKQRVWVAPPTSDVKDKLAAETVIYSYFPTTRNALNAVRNLFLAWRVMRRLHPGMLISAGAGVTVPFFIIAWLMRIPTVFIEVYDRVDTATLTGRLVGPFTTRQIVQWESQLEAYPDAKLVGPLL